MTINDEITNQIIDLYFNQHKTIREVCRILGKSSHDVVPVIKEQRLKVAPNTHDNKQQEKDLPEVKAYKLFAEGKSPIEVVTKLNLSGSTVQQYYMKYWDLENMHELNEIYNEIKDSMGYFVKLVRLAKKST
jgi:hypothetical protein